VGSRRLVVVADALVRVLMLAVFALGAVPRRLGGGGDVRAGPRAGCAENAKGRPGVRYEVAGAEQIGRLALCSGSQCADVRR
jgi:hypothetical protein